MLMDEFKGGYPKSVVVLQNIDAVRELIMQDPHVTYREIKASLSIKVFEEISKNNRQRRIILHHDSASCHMSAETTQCLEGQKNELTGHPAYSPDLVPIDFYYSQASRIYVVNVFRAAKKPLMRSKLHVQTLQACEINYNNNIFGRDVLRALEECGSVQTWKWILTSELEGGTSQKLWKVVRKE
ncbi:hypothetical protein EVAR_82776_1 [Eumeta japonica]|uniref:Mariner Mos1 transposase n=1 Tax=Eumeta variegata TaxID=151549 RepID=A0A4C1UNV8_EUMVA|nr:hypothetical protein EVAR_82776_1 [Eumeta japonica]